MYSRPNDTTPNLEDNVTETSNNRITGSLVEASKDANLAIAYARQYANVNSDGSVVYGLMKAHEYDPSHPLFEKSENIQKILSNIRSIIFGHLFEYGKAGYWLLDEIAKCKSIVEMDLSFGNISNSLNKHFLYYLSKANYIKKIDASSHSNHRLFPKNIGNLVQGLAINTSIEVIVLCDNRIQDAGVLLILNALRANSSNRVRELNLFSNGISEEGGAAIIKFIQEQNNLTHVNLRGNTRISEQTIEKIERITSEKIARIKALDSQTVSLGRSSIFSSITSSSSETAFFKAKPSYHLETGHPKAAIKSHEKLREVEALLDDGQTYQGINFEL